MCVGYPCFSLSVLTELFVGDKRKHSTGGNATITVQSAADRFVLVDS